MSLHKPVLLEEVLEYLDPQSNQNYIDCTLGGGGHTKAILEKSAPDGKILALDADQAAIQRFKLQITPKNASTGSANTGQAKSKLQKNRIILINSNFSELENIYAQRFPYHVSGILLDLGLSSDQLEQKSRGFSFQKDGPLDMRFAHTRTKEHKNERTDNNNLTAVEIVNKWSQYELEKILRVYGEEEKAEQIAREIVRVRKKQVIDTTFKLKEIINKTKVPNRRASLAEAKPRRAKIHPATKTFQALRIAVNAELEVLEKVLPQAVDILGEPVSPKRSLGGRGRLAVISFHGLEDRIVKMFFKDQAKIGNVKILTKKPISATSQETKENPRSRSAKLRVVEVL